MNPILNYDTGFPTRLVNHPHLAELLEAHGEPVSIRKVGGSYKLEWSPLYPGVPIPEWSIIDPWPKDKRKLVSVTLRAQPGPYKFKRPTTVQDAPRKRYDSTNQRWNARGC